MARQVLMGQHPCTFFGRRTEKYDDVKKREHQILGNLFNPRIVSTCIYYECKGQRLTEQQQINNTIIHFYLQDRKQLFSN